MVPELQMDSSFVARLKAILSEYSDWGPSMFSCSTTCRNLHFIFIPKKDSPDYYIQVELDEDPGIRSKGFFEHKGFMYWFYGNTPPGIILRTTESKREFSCKEYHAFREKKKEDDDSPEITDIIDPIIRFLTYDYQTGKMGWVSFDEFPIF